MASSNTGRLSIRRTRGEIAAAPAFFEGSHPDPSIILLCRHGSMQIEQVRKQAEGCLVGAQVMAWRKFCARFTLLLEEHAQAIFCGP